MSRRPTARSDVRQRRTAGWPTAREGHGHGAPTVVVGVTPHQGGQDSCPQGEAASREGGRESPPLDKEEAGQVLAASSRGRYARCRPPHLDGCRPQSRAACEHWKAGCPESGHVRFGGGADGKGSQDTSPAAYSTWNGGKAAKPDLSLPKSSKPSTYSGDGSCKAISDERNGSWNSANSATAAISTT